MNALNKLINQIKTSPEITEFQDVINIIDTNYHYTPTYFTNGPEDDCVINNAGENEGSCKIFSFAQLQQLDETQTLNCFGDYYRNDVLQHPNHSDHANIRTFIKYGWKNITFQGTALEKKDA